MKNKFRFRKESIISIIASILIFIFFNLLFYNKMPDSLPTHWNFNSEVDSYGTRFEAMIGIHIFLIAMNIFLCFMLDNDPKNKKQNNFVITISKFSIPTIMFIIYLITVLSGFGIDVKATNIITPFVGLLFIAIGNYMPKIKRNYTVGIKLPWTLNSDENWRRTHRVGGYSFIFAGILFLIMTFFRYEFLILIPFIICMLIPMIYSFYLYRKGV
ncbi:SdpI family protein [Peptoniphilus sp. MSJ-1]|uniref:SdpI family protein n=1 Tax=Peptoniphilus ovalis TaxID=2841503 RepID=A0ABS6FHT9_9FIRM|nr:SdpI family protein [Peptoniphilus ovalis]MBU5669743.1 SdpI family protein [Peptoniphilus ovalis]